MTFNLFVVAAAIGLTSFAAPALPEKKDDPASTPIALPKDPKAVVVTFDPGANGFIRKGEAPFLKIQADGQVLVTNVVDGTKKESKLTPEQLQELLRFIIKENELFDVTAAQIDKEIKAAQAAMGIGIALGGASTSEISMNADGKQHQVGYRGAASYLRTYPKIKPLAQLVAVEKRLMDLGLSIQKGK